MENAKRVINKGKKLVIRILIRSEGRHENRKNGLNRRKGTAVIVCVRMSSRARDRPVSQNGRLWDGALSRGSLLPIHSHIIRVCTWSAEANIDICGVRQVLPREGHGHRTASADSRRVKTNVAYKGRKVRLRFQIGA